MSDLNRTNNVNIGGNSYQTTEAIDADNVTKVEKSLAAAKTGTLSVRTDNDTGTLTMDPGHGILTGDKVDIYWSGGSRRGVTVGTVATNSVPIDLGAGDNLPAAATAVTVMVQNSETVSITGANVVAIAFKCAGKATLQITQSNDTEIFGTTVSAGGSYIWTVGSGVTNPVTGQTIGKVKITHGDSTKTQKPRVHILSN